MEVVLLGTGSADGWPNPFCTCASCTAALASHVVRGQSAALLDEVLLLDCGPEAPRAAARAGRRLDRVTDVLLTHSHPDHTGPAALLWRAWAERREPITVHGPAEALAACRDWVGPTDPVTFHPVVAGDAFGTTHHSVNALAATHGDDGAGPGLLWDVTDRAGARLLYATDTGWPSEETLTALTTAQPYDLVLLEETFGDRHDLGGDHLHLATFAALLGRLRAAGSVRADSRVVAIHLGHHNPPPAALDTLLGDLGATAGRDGEVIVIGDGIAPPTVGPRRTLVLGGARSGKSWHAEHLASAEPHVIYVATGGVPGEPFDFPAPGHTHSEQFDLWRSNSSRPRPPGDDADSEWAARVAAHRARRPEGWSTIETTDVADVLTAAAADRCVLVDCLTLWLTRRMDSAGWWDVDKDEEATAQARKQLDADVTTLLQALRETPARVIVVSNEIGQGVVPATRSGRDFRDELGRLNAAVAAEVDQVSYLVAGQVLSLKGPDR